jgi:hypothetical protein
MKGGYIKIDFKGTECKDMAQDKIHWLALVNM